MQEVISYICRLSESPALKCIFNFAVGTRLISELSGSASDAILGAWLSNILKFDIKKHISGSRKCEGTEKTKNL